MHDGASRPCVLCDRPADCKLISMVEDREEHFCDGHRWVAIAAAGDPSRQWEFENLRPRKKSLPPYSPL